MRSYFDDADRQARLREVARAWAKTPFHPHAAIRGVGVDCVNLLAAIYTESGALDGWEFPAYTMDGGDHRHTSQVLAWLDAHEKFARLPEDAPLVPGDLLSFRLGRVPHHVGLYLGERLFIHALRHCGVTESRLDDPTFGKRLKARYRPLP